MKPVGPVIRFAGGPQDGLEIAGEVGIGPSGRRTILFGRAATPGEPRPSANVSPFGPSRVPGEVVVSWCSYDFESAEGSTLLYRHVATPRGPSISDPEAGA